MTSSKGKFVGMLMLLSTTTGAVRAQSLTDFVSEAGVRASLDGNTLRLEGGVGWLRSPRLFSDFIVEFEYRLLEAGSHAALGFRSWPGYPGLGSPGYRIHLTEPRDGLTPVGQMEATVVTLKGVAMEYRAATESEPVGGWHRVRVHVERGSAVVAVDGRIVSAAEQLNEFTGYLTLSSANGASEFRAFTVNPLPSWKEPFGAGAYRMSEPGLQPPRATREANPYYPKEPHASGIQGTVRLDVVIFEDGSPGDVRVTTSIQSDLDEAAIASARKWHFIPGMKDGAPVQVIVSMEIGFTLTDRRTGGGRRAAVAEARSLGGQ